MFVRLNRVMKFLIVVGMGNSLIGACIRNHLFVVGKCLISADAGIANGLRKANFCREGKPGRGEMMILSFISIIFIIFIFIQLSFISNWSLIHCNRKCDLNVHCPMHCQHFETFGLEFVYVQIWHKFFWRLF